MLFTKECDYAIRIMRALSGGELMSVPKISQREKLPSAMTYKIARKLEKAGLLKSSRGSNGGYALGKSLEDITLHDICSVIMPDILMFECMKKDYVCPMNSTKHPCGVHCELLRIQGLMVDELRKRSLKELFDN